MSQPSSYCYYHPAQPAVVVCRQCIRRYCSACLEGAQEHAECPRCKSLLSHIEALDEVQPFWERLGLFFLRPFTRSRAWVFMTLGALLGGLGGWIGFSFIGLAIGAILVLPACASVLWHVSRGQMNRDGFGDLFGAPRLNLLYRVSLLTLLLATVVTGITLWLGAPTAMIAFAVLMVFALGAFVMLVHTGSLDRSLGPGGILYSLQILGRVYALLWCYWVACAWLVWAWCDMWLSLWPGPVGAALSAFSINYSLLVGSHLLAYVVLQYRPRLLEATGDKTREVVARRHSEAPPTASGVQRGALIRLDMALKEGDYQGAEGILKKMLQKNPSDRNALNKLFQLSRERGQLGNLDRFRHALAQLLLDDPGRRSELIEYLRERITSDEEFELRESEVLYRVVRALYFAGEHRLLLKLLNDIEGRMPGLPRMVECLLLMATSLANGLNKPPKARAYLLHLQKAYGHHRLASHYAEWIRHLEQKGRLPEPQADFGELV